MPDPGGGASHQSPCQSPSLAQEGDGGGFDRCIPPVYIEHRCRNTYHQINPVPYYAQYYGHKLHIDQNEKLIQFGVTHVAAADGYSGKLMGIVTMPIKNPILIYDLLYKLVSWI